MLPGTRSVDWCGAVPSQHLQRNEGSRFVIVHAQRGARCSLFQLGARFLAGSAATNYGIIPGSGLHLELALLHRIGLSPREAIAAATSNFADIYGWLDIGRIEPGRVVDLLILDSAPRSDLEALNHIDVKIFQGGCGQSESLTRSTSRK
jgi:hypothetical protein